MVRYFSMFTGVGGFELGIKQARPDWECVGVSEIDKFSNQVLEHRFKGVRNYGDATKINTDELPDFDFLCGGFPCQAFSIAGNRRGFEDTRGTMFFEIARIIKAKRPKYCLLENVKGLLNHDKGKTFSTIIQTLDELGYETQWMVLNSKFFGVPQNRERVFIIGNLRGTSRPEILPFRENAAEIQRVSREEKPEMLGLLKQTCKKRVYDTPKEINEYLRECNGQYTMRQLAKLLGLPKTQVEHYFRTDNSRGVPSPKIWLKMKELLGFDNTWDKQVTDIYEKEIEFEQTRRVWNSEGMSPTLNATQEHTIQVMDYRNDEGFRVRKESLSPCLASRKHSQTDISTMPPLVMNLQTRSADRPSLKKNPKAGGSGTIAKIDEAYCLDSACTQGVYQNSLRRLTPVECCRLQGFPDDWNDICSDTQRYKQMGNAVTVNVIREIIRGW